MLGFDGYVPAQIKRADESAIPFDFKEFSQRAINVKWFGAKGDGITDDTAAIQKAINACGEDDILYFPKGTYFVTDSLKITCHVEGRSAIIVTNKTLNPVIQLGEDDKKTYNKYFILPSVIQNTKTWNGDIGIKCINLYSCRVVITRIVKFEIGLLVTAKGNGCCYNDFFIGHLENNKVNLRIKPEDDKGWTNENNYFGGRYSHYSNEGTNVPGTRHIEILPFDINNSETSWPNNNVFYKPSVEGNVPEYHIVISGMYNTFINPRFDAQSPKVYLLGHDTVIKTASNMFLGGHNVTLVEFQTSGIIRYTNIISPSTSSFAGTSAVLNLQNIGSSDYPLIQGFYSTGNCLNKKVDATDWTIRLTSKSLLGKRDTDQNERIKIDFDNSRIYLGDGQNPPAKYIGNSSNGIRYYGGNLEIDGGGYNTPHLVLGNYHIWVDSNGKLRIKNGVPTTDTDGQIIGTQT